MRRVMAAVVVGALVAGCATVELGRPLDFEVLRSLKPGVTTTEDVLALLGEPYVKSFVGDEEHWLFMSVKSQAYAMPFYVHSTTAPATSALLRFRDGVLIR